MINKTFRLNNGYWHKFVPKTNKLFSPQNIKIEVWDLSTRKIVEKFHPTIFCIDHCCFNKSGDQFVFQGGCFGGESEFKIYNTETLEIIQELRIPEQTTNPIYSLNQNHLYFGTWDGNLYKYKFDEKIISTIQKSQVDGKEYKYTINDKNREKLVHLKDSMITLIEADIENEILYLAVSPKVNNKRYSEANYILAYNIKTKEKQ